MLNDYKNEVESAIEENVSRQNDMILCANLTLRELPLSKHF